MTVSQETQPIGPLVDPRPAPRPVHVTLKGRAVTLVALDVAHAPALYGGSHGDGRESLWTYLFNGPFAEEAEFTADVEAKAKAADPLYHAIIDNATGKAVGYQSLMRIDPAHRVIEVGGILYTPAMQRTVGATEAQYLFARHVFDDLGYRRYEWKCNDFNAPSKRAATRFGFTFEGVFRQHMIVKSRNRDTAWFSMLDCEWPARRAEFQRWLDPDNFDAAGRQKTNLDMGIAK
jgi:RimJ/RimL family protein N-acetyltransferase